MRNYQAVLGIVFILILSIVLIACGNSKEDVDPLNSTTNNVKEKSFQMLLKDISNATIHTDSTDLDITGVIDHSKDVQTMVDILNDSPALIGDATADFYRLLKISMKDGSVITLEFGGQGRFFKVVETGVFYDVESKGNVKLLNEFINRIEKKAVAMKAFL